MSKVRSEQCPQQIQEIKRLEKSNAQRAEVEAKFKIRLIKKQEVENKYKETDTRFENIVTDLTQKYEAIQN